jgi:hypothetical protein
MRRTRSKPLMVMLTPEDHERFRTWAADNSMSMRQLVETAVETYIRRNNVGSFAERIEKLELAIKIGRTP